MLHIVNGNYPSLSLACLAMLPPSQDNEIVHEASLNAILSIERTTKAQISLRICAG